MGNTICPQCNAWRCHPSDRFCGQCGEILIRPQINVRPLVLYRDHEIPAKITITVTSEGLGMGGTDLLWRDPSGNQEDFLIAHLGDNELAQAGEQKDYYTTVQDLHIDNLSLDQRHLIHRLLPEKEYIVSTLRAGTEIARLELDKTTLVLNPNDTEALLILQNIGGDSALIDLLRIFWPSASRDLPLLEPKLVPVKILAKQNFLEIKFEISKHLLNVLLNNPLGIEFELYITLPDIEHPIRLPFWLRSPSPAKPAITVPEELRIMQGRTLAIPIQLENQGGETCRAMKTSIELRGGNDSSQTIAFENLDPTTLEPGDNPIRSIRINLSEVETQSSGGYFCIISQLFETTENETVECSFRIIVVPEHEFKGVVAVDFGTTATAAARFTFDAPPESIELSPEIHIPTTIAYFLDADKNLTYRIGSEAKKALEQEAELGSVEYLENLKWRLDNPEPVILPDGSSRHWVDIIADYLKALKPIIEDNPKITAKVSNVVITQPAHFNPINSVNLHEAFRRAGLEPKVMPVPEGTLDYLSESWSSAILCLPRPDIDKLRIEAIGDPVFENTSDAKHSVLTFDVGGGSTDISLLSIEILDRANMSVTELAAESDNINYHGNGFAQLLFDCIWPYCEQWLKNNGYDPSQFPIRLPWQAVKSGKTEKIARHNGQQFYQSVLNDLIREEFGPIFNVAGRIRTQLADMDSNEEIPDWSSIDSGETQKLLKYFIDNDSEVELINPFNDTTITIPPGNPGVYLDFPQLADIFFKNIAAPMNRRLEKLLSELPETEAKKVVCLVSGRGARFPLVINSLTGQCERLTKKIEHIESIDVTRIEFKYAKTIVSSGACYIENLLRSQTGIVFRPRDLMEFGVGSGSHDQATGQEIFLRICTGLPSQNNFIETPFELLGRRELRLFFYLSNTQSGRIDTDRDYRVGQVDGSLAKLPAENEQAFLLVRATSDRQIEVAVGVIASGSESPKQWDDWNPQILGELNIKFAFHT